MKLLLLLLLIFNVNIYAKQIALVVANSNYYYIENLNNPINDATDIAKKLDSLGNWQVLLYKNTSKTELEQAFTQFLSQLQPKDTALFYYSGHGIQVDGKNYIIPVDAKITDEYTLKYNTVELNEFIFTLQQKNTTSLVFLDACRDNPFAKQLTRSTSANRGLARYEGGGVGILIVYATSPGNVALDGNNRNSPFTQAFLKHIDTPNLEIHALLREIRKTVVKQTKGKQVPWDHSSLIEDFYFKKETDSTSSTFPNFKKTNAKKIEILLKGCDLHFKNNRLTSGRGGNALSCYQEVLALDPNNIEAKQGIDAITQQYIDNIEKALSGFDIEKAEKQLDILIYIQKNHPSINKFKQQIALLKPSVTKPLNPVNTEKFQAPIMVTIPTGNFTMGSPTSELYSQNDEQQENVIIYKNYAIGKYEVSVEDFSQFIKETKYTTDAEISGGCWLQDNKGNWIQDKNLSWYNPSFSQEKDHPVVCVSINDIYAYLDWLYIKTGEFYRLPTEAEWEYAARAGTNTIFWWGNTITAHQANYYALLGYGDSYKGTYRGKTVNKYMFSSNPWGLYNIHGNVWEWTCSLYTEKYDGSNEFKCSTDFHNKWVVRGGSWASPPEHLRSAIRGKYMPNTNSIYLGFRVVKDF